MALIDAANHPCVGSVPQHRQAISTKLHQAHRFPLLRDHWIPILKRIAANGDTGAHSLRNTTSARTEDQLAARPSDGDAAATMCSA